MPMRASRVLLVVLITGLLGALAVAFAPPSSAGGPTSVLLVDTETGRATALYTTDLRYQRLSDLVGAMGTPRSDGSAPPGSGGGWSPGSGGITLTWMMHDVVVWRVDHVFVAADGTVFIASASDLGGGLSGLDQKLAWHRASDAKKLTSLLAGLGLGPQATSAPAPAAASAASTPSAAPPRQATAAPTSATVPGPLWGMAGLALGAGLVLGVGPLLGIGRFGRRARPAPEGDDDVPELPESAEVLQG